MMQRTSICRLWYDTHYLYRQKYMVGNLENIGFCMPGYQGYTTCDYGGKADYNRTGCQVASKLVYLRRTGWKGNKTKSLALFGQGQRYRRRMEETIFQLKEALRL